MVDGIPVFVDGGEGGFTDGHLAFLAALAADVEQALGGVELSDGELAGFADAEAGGVEEFEQGPIAQEKVGTDWFVGGGGEAKASEFGLGCREQGGDVGFLKEAGQATGQFGEPELAGRGRGAETFTDEPSEEGAERAEPEGDGGGVVFPATEPSEIEAEFVAGNDGPVCGAPQLLLVPGGELGEGLTVVADGVGGSVPAGFEMLEETGGERIGMGGRFGHVRRLHGIPPGGESWFLRSRVSGCGWWRGVEQVGDLSGRNLSAMRTGWNPDMPTSR